MADLGTAYIQVLPSTKGIGKNIEKELNGEMGDAGEKGGNSFASGFAKVLAGAGKVTLAAVGAAATGVALITKQAVTSYAQYEQLVGGAKKIFDEMDYSQIAADAANAYKDLNMSASQYLDAINLAGATFASTMGDQKGYEVARQGMKAIADYASGTGKNINELNQKYQMITRSTSSYQSIADQFSGILPQTSADFLEQAQAAGLLSDKYTQLTQVPVAEYQQAVTAMLEKGVDALGLAGNTANESFGTLSGSINMTKAAWENFVTGLADPDADLGSIIDNLIESASAAVKNLIPVITTSLEGIGSALKEITPIVAAELPGMIEALLPGLLSAVESLISGVVEALPPLLQVIADEAPSLINTIVDGVLGQLPAILDAAFQIITTLANGLTESFPTLVPTVIDIVLQIVQTIVDNVDDLLIAATDMILALVEGLEASTPTLLEQAPVIIQSLSDAIIAALPTLLAATAELMAIIVEGIAQNLPQMLESAGEIIGTLAEGIIANLPVILEAAAKAASSFSDHFSEVDWNSLGTNIIDGIVAGISASASAIASAARKAAQSALDSAKSLLGIKSPSRVFRDQVGQMIGEGMALGIEDSESAVDKAMNALSDSAVGTATATVTANAKGNATSVYGEESVYQAQLAGIGNITIPVYIGQQKFAQAVVNAQNVMNYRSGGR